MLRVTLVCEWVCKINSCCQRSLDFLWTGAVQGMYSSLWVLTDSSSLCWEKPAAARAALHLLLHQMDCCISITSFLVFIVHHSASEFSGYQLITPEQSMRKWRINSVNLKEEMKSEATFVTGVWAGQVTVLENRLHESWGLRKRECWP